MGFTRRQFIQSAAITTGLAGAAASLTARITGSSGPETADRMPMVDFGGVMVSRLVVGMNPFYGYAHYNRILSSLMREWYTTEKVVEILEQCEKHGINAYNYLHSDRSHKDWKRFRARGGGIHLICQGTGDDPTELVEAVRPLGVFVQGEKTDNAYRAGRMDTVRNYCRKLRDLDVRMVGVGSHIPEVLSMIEEQDWDVDFYAGCVYNRRRTEAELCDLLGGELPEMSSEVYLRDDPPRMYEVFRQTSKPCVAFKILAAGRVRNAEYAFRQAFGNIKKTDLVMVGMFPRIMDEVEENAHWTAVHGA